MFGEIMSFLNLAGNSCQLSAISFQLSAFSCQQQFGVGVGIGIGVEKNQFLLDRTLIKADSDTDPDVQGASSATRQFD